MAKKVTFKLFCNACKNETVHETVHELHKVETTDVDIDDEIFTFTMYDTKYQIVNCKGCETPSFRMIDRFPDSMQLNDDDSIKIVLSYEVATVFPERQKDLIQERRFQGVPKKTQLLYREVIDSINNNNLYMCTVGINMLIKKIANHFFPLSNSPKEAYDKMSQTGLLQLELSESLKAIIFQTDQLIENSDALNKSECREFLEIVELTFQNVFQIPIRTSILKNRLTESMLNLKS